MTNLWQMNLQKIVEAVRRRWIAAASLALAVGCCCTVAVLRQGSVYMAECKLEFASSAPEVSLDSRTLLRYSSYVLQNLFLNSQMIIIKSDPVLSRTVTSLNLADPVRDPEGFQRAQRSVSGAFNITRLQDSQIFLVRARHSDPKMAQAIANTVAESYIRYSYEKKVENYKSSIDWLDEKLVDLKAKLEQSQRSLIDFIEKEKITSFGSENGREEAPAALPNAEIAESESLMQKLHSSKVEEELQLQRISEKYLPAHPEYKKAQAEIALLDRKIKEEEKRQVGLRQDRDAVIIRSKKNEIQYSILSREVEVNKEIYNALIRKHKETDIGSAIVQTDASIIERAQLPRGPVAPNKPLQVTLAWLLGLLLAVGYCWVVEYGDATLKRPQDIENHFSWPLLSVIGKDAQHSAGATGKLPVFVKDDDPHFGEPFRILRTNLNLSFPKGDHGRIIMVGSTHKGEGKSTITMNLAQSTAELKRRTLLIDCDLRARNLTRHFDLLEAPGMTNYLVGEKSFRDIVRPSGIPNLWFVPAGQVPPMPSTLLDSEAMRTLLRDLRQEFDEVIIDTPPVGLVIDATIVASLVDGVIVVVEAGRLTRHTLLKNVGILEKLPVRVCGLVLNKVHTSSSQGYYGSYGYYGTDAKGDPTAYRLSSSSARKAG